MSIKSITNKNQSPSTIISVRELVKEYKIGHRKIRVLDIKSLDIFRGEFVAIMGASGSGKSTLLQMLGGLDRPTSGTIAVNGAIIDKMNDRKLSNFRNRTIGFVFQSFYLQPFLNLEQNIEIAAMPSRMKRSERKRLAREIAASVGLSEHLDHKPSELSGGQIQRVAIARALINQPQIIIADEPTGNLDATNSHDVISLIQDLKLNLGTTVIVATHDPEIASLADRVITIKDGEISC